MPIIHRQKAFHRLTPEQQKAKLQKDSDYEIAVHNIYADKSLTPEQKQSQKVTLWNFYLEWAKANGLYEQVSLEQQLAEADAALNVSVGQVNLIRTELGKPLLEVKEKIVK